MWKKFFKKLWVYNQPRSSCIKLHIYVCREDVQVGVIVVHILFISIPEHFSDSSKFRQKHYSCVYNFVFLYINRTITWFLDQTVTFCVQAPLVFIYQTVTFCVQAYLQFKKFKSDYLYESSLSRRRSNSGDLYVSNLRLSRSNSYSLFDQGIITLPH